MSYLSHLLKETDWPELAKQVQRWYEYQQAMIDASDYWTHEEQMELSERYKCILVKHEERWKLMSLQKGILDPEEHISRFAPLDPLCAKVLSYVIAGKLIGPPK